MQNFQMERIAVPRLSRTRSSSARSIPRFALNRLNSRRFGQVSMNRDWSLSCILLFEDQVNGATRQKEALSGSTRRLSG